MRYHAVNRLRFLDSYTRMKASKTLREHWQHTRYCGLTEVGREGERYLPSPL